MARRAPPRRPSRTVKVGVKRPSKPHIVERFKLSPVERLLLLGGGAARTYKRVLSDANATAVTDHVVKVSLTSSNFNFAKAQSDGSDVWFKDATTGVSLPFWIKSWDSVGQTAELWVRVADIAHTHEIHYGGLSNWQSDGEATFNWFAGFSQGSNGQIPYPFARDSAVISFDASNQIDLSTTQGNPGRAKAWLTNSTLVTTGAGPNQFSGSRLPHQRQCFYAAGLYWLFWGDYSGGGAGPYNLNFRTSANGSTWSSDTTLTTFPIYDAQWAILYDDAAGKVHVAKTTQTGGTLVHDGLTYRRGTPNSNGTITWDAAFQTAIATGNNVGDFSLALDVNGRIWVGYADSNSADAVAKGNAKCVMNSE